MSSDSDTFEWIVGKTRTLSFRWVDNAKGIKFIIYACIFIGITFVPVSFVRRNI
jgi:hypothetical protein